MRQIAFFIAAATISLVGHAATGPQNSQYKELYKCFNQAQMGDAPMISIEADQKGNQYVHVTNLGMNSYFNLKRTNQIGPMDVSYFSTSGFEVMENSGIENPPARAYVKALGLGLMYNCGPTAH